MLYRSHIILFCKGGVVPDIDAFRPALRLVGYVQRRAALLGWLLLSSIGLVPMTACSNDDASSREIMVRTVEREMATLSEVLGERGLDARVRDALLEVPRHAFVPDDLDFMAYTNRPLPIGADQTISQPLIVALMSQLLDVAPGGRVYELGTGSGYQAAVLAAMGIDVYSVEIVPELARRARRALQDSGYERVQVRAGDGYPGWPEQAPFDGVIVTAAGNRIPQALVDQLAIGGRLVMPIGPDGGVQQLIVLTKGADGSVQQRDVLPVRFVPITGGPDR